MPQVTSYTPPWLSRPSPGASLFYSPPAKDLGPSVNGRRKSDYSGPTRTLARRGSEVFAVVDNQIRWASLTKLKDEWKLQSRAKKDSAMKGNPGDSKDKCSAQGYYRVCSQTAPIQLDRRLIRLGLECTSLRADQADSSFTEWEFPCYRNGPYRPHFCPPGFLPSLLL